MTSRFRKALASTAIIATLTAGVWAGLGSPAVSGGETRTLSLYHVHTGEKLTVTYMVNGKYVPSAMKQINYLMRDWRKNKTIIIDPKTIDLMWELHADLGSKAPIHIVCGYRSAATNAFLKRSGRNVARKSQHILGKAIDLYFPDVPTIRIRNSALVRQVGGVGYYRSSGGPTGFLHVDSGHVRHWGPGISAREMASIFRDYRKTVGARLTHGDQIMVASSKFKAPSQDDTPQVSQAPDDYADEEMAQLSEDASQAPARPKAKPDAASDAAPQAVAAAVIVPKPRPKPIEVLMAAAVNMKIEPASAPPEQDGAKADSPVADSIGTVIAASEMTEDNSGTLTSNADAKVSLARSLSDGTATGVPVIRTLSVASAAGSDTSWWPGLKIFGGDQDVRRFGSPQPFTESASAGILPGDAAAAEAPVMPQVAPETLQEVADGKSDRLVVNRDGKGNLESSAAPARRLTVGQLSDQ